MSVDFTPNRAGLEVLTPSGFMNFAGLSVAGFRSVLELRFGNGRRLRCTPDHKLLRANGEMAAVDRMSVGDWVITKAGRRTKLTARILISEPKLVYDLINVEGGRRYFTNGLISHNCSFVTDEETLVNPLTLARLQGVSPLFYTGTVRWFGEPQPNRTYLVALDPSLGTGRDYAAIQVFQLPEMLQVAEWQHNGTDPRGQVRTLMQTLIYLDGVLREDPAQASEPDIFWTVENNAIGEALLQIIEDTGEERFPGVFVSERRRRGQGRHRKGLLTTSRAKITACSRLKGLIESDRMRLSSGNLVKQLKGFVAKEQSFGAKPGEHDDLVMALVLVVRMLDSAGEWGGNVGDLRQYIDEDELGESEPMPMAF